MVNGGEFDGAKAYKDSKVGWDAAASCIWPICWQPMQCGPAISRIACKLNFDILSRASACMRSWIYCNLQHTNSPGQTIAVVK